MKFLRDSAGSITALSLAAFVAHYTDVHLYAVVCMGIQWLSALYAIPKQTERYFDLTGSITYALVSFLAYSTNGPMSWRASLVVGFVWLWCARLGWFLFQRMNECNEDKRFTEIRVRPLQFLSVWSLQGLWVLVTLLSVLLMLKHGTHDAPLSLLDVAGVFLWSVGYAMEVVADSQKTQFRRDARHKGQFIQTGLWYYSRHPNYWGEIVLWTGVCCVSVHTLETRALKAWAVLSPTFVAFLLLFVSGIPLLEKQADERWGETKAYQKYKAETSLLIPLPKRKVKVG
ncbi:hypothetical protein PsorP6_015650 [Peronosclerospora sorghi]|uniref:Uncharacterized protein n=1 Tax=Peronosclerospora sorghi TaxID=230839 RepID=A0ACC0WPU7_9STRA|nr:hypothetical protein PsorP6_015650 [Peronosclerospora sorghi]